MKAIQEAILVQKVDKYDGGDYIPEEFVDRDMQYIYLNTCDIDDVIRLNMELVVGELVVVKPLDLLYTDVVRDAKGRLYAVIIK